jgi:hypothetical protein
VETDNGRRLQLFVPHLIQDCSAATQP